MPNLAAVIKAEITRLAKREAKSVTADLKRASVWYRTETAMLKLHLGQQEREIKLLKKQTQQQQGNHNPLRMNWKAFAFRLIREGSTKSVWMSAANYGKLVGVSGLTIYAGQGKSSPRQAQLAALVAVRGIGKREALKSYEVTPKKKGKRR